MLSLQFGVNSRIQLGSRSGNWVIIRFRLGHIHIYIQIILVYSTLDKANIRKATHESTTMAKARKTPRPQKYPAKTKAAVNKMKGAATTAPGYPDESDEPDMPGEAEVKVGIESVVWDHPEAEQHIKSDEMSVDDGATGIQSVLEAAAAVVSLSGVTTKKTVLAVGPNKPKAKKPSPSKRKTPVSKAKKHGPQVMNRYFGYIFLNSAGTMLIMAQ
jgi:hypothetical protein